jgi:hypothetical protein
MLLCAAHGSNTNQPCTCWAYRPVPARWMPCPVHGRNERSLCRCYEYDTGQDDDHEDERR